MSPLLLPDVGIVSASPLLAPSNKTYGAIRLEDCRKFSVDSTLLLFNFNDYSYRAELRIADTMKTSPQNHSKAHMNALRQGHHRMTRYFLFSGGIVFSLTAAAKILMAVGDAEILKMPDPLFTDLSNRTLLVLAAVMELSVVVYICRSNVSYLRRIGAIVWIATVFLSYRFGLIYTGNRGGCKCLGNIGDSLRLSPAALDLVASSILAYLLLGSLILFVRASRLEWKQGLIPSETKTSGRHEHANAESRSS